jgi:hypothetical protein
VKTILRFLVCGASIWPVATAAAAPGPPTFGAREWLCGSEITYAL